MLTHRPFRPVNSLSALLLLSVALRAADSFVGLWDLDIAKSRIRNPQVLKRVEMTFTEKDGGLEWADVQYRVDGSTPKRTLLIRIDEMDHPVPTNPGSTYNARWLDSTTIERVYRRNGKYVGITIDSLMPDGNTLMQFTHSFNPDGSFRNDETQIWHRHVD